jgi:hypothetical protein
MEETYTLHTSLVSDLITVASSDYAVFHINYCARYMYLQGLDKIKETLQIFWVFGLFPSSGILENTTFQKLDLFPLDQWLRSALSKGPN